MLTVIKVFKTNYWTTVGLDSKSFLNPELCSIAACRDGDTPATTKRKEKLPHVVDISFKHTFGAVLVELAFHI